MESLHRSGDFGRGIRKKTTEVVTTGIRTYYLNNASEPISSPGRGQDAADDLVVGSPAQQAVRDERGGFFAVLAFPAKAGSSKAHRAFAGRKPIAQGRWAGG